MRLPHCSSRFWRYLSNCSLLVRLWGPLVGRCKTGVHAEVDEVAVKVSALPVRRTVQSQHPSQTGHLVVDEGVHRIEDYGPDPRLSGFMAARVKPLVTG